MYYLKYKLIISNIIQRVPDAKYCRKFFSQTIRRYWAFLAICGQKYLFCSKMKKRVIVRNDQNVQNYVLYHTQSNKNSKKVNF